MNVTVDKEDFDMSLSYAFRYALGRSSYAVSDVVSLIAEYRHILSNTTKTNMVEDIKRALDREEAGIDHCKHLWTELLEKLVWEPN